MVEASTDLEPFFVGRHSFAIEAREAHGAVANHGHFRVAEFTKRNRGKHEQRGLMSLSNARGWMLIHNDCNYASYSLACGFRLRVSYRSSARDTYLRINAYLDSDSITKSDEPGKH